MAFPTRHWRKLQSILLPGQLGTAAHGLRDGRNGTTIIPDVVLFEMGVAGYTTWPNEQIGKWQADDATNVYLSNWDAANAHLYSVVARSYYSDDDQNF
jgi:hypothetical protein